MVKVDERQVAVVSMRADLFIDQVENVTTGIVQTKNERETGDQE